MRPSARQLIDSISWSLQEKVVPVTEDKWAASTLRSVRCLLEHLSQRVDVEGGLLFEDNRDARSTLDGVRASLAGNASGAADTTDPISAWCAAVAAGLERTWRAPDEYPSVASLSDENHDLRRLVDEGIRVLPTPARQELETYVRRRLARDQPLFAPFMAGVF